VKILAIDTATEPISAAVWDETGVRGEETCRVDGQASRELFPAIHRLLAGRGWTVAGLGGLAVSIGPGSFTGLRVGVSTVKGLCGAHAIPAVAVGTLDALVLASGCEGRIAACLDARRGHIYARLFERDGHREVRPLTDEVLAEPSEWAASLPKDDHLWLIGSGATTYREAFVGELGVHARFAEPSMSMAAAVAVLGAHQLAQGKVVAVSELLPRYIRPSTADVNFRLGLVGSRQRRVWGKASQHG